MSDNTDLSGRTVVITGAARGLGEAVARACRARGAELVLTDVLDDQLRRLADDLGDRACGHHLDVTDPEHWDVLAEHLRATCGRPDVLVNNAGIVRPAPIAETSYDDFRRSLDVNLGGAFLGISMFVQLHRESESARPGSIINISSVRGLVGAANAVGYCASKFGLRGLTKAAAVELGPSGIRVNSVCPGPIETEMSLGNADFSGMDWDAYVARLPLGAMGRPADIGEAVAWLASDASAFVTGVDLPVDGGLTATSYTVEPKP